MNESFQEEICLMMMIKSLTRNFFFGKFVPDNRSELSFERCQISPQDGGF